MNLKSQPQQQRRHYNNKRRHQPEPHPEPQLPPATHVLLGHEIDKQINMLHACGNYHGEALWRRYKDAVIEYQRGRTAMPHQPNTMSYQKYFRFHKRPDMYVQASISK